MRSNAAPGPDGLNAEFYKSSWDWTGKDVIKLVSDFYNNAHLQPELNMTHIAMIPKINNPMTPKDYRPISLCNVVYKIIAKSLAERIKSHLPHIIHPSQTAFIKGRHIASNIIIAQEILHSFNLKNWKHKAFLLKVDLAKAFDRIEWHFIVSALKRQGFKDKFVDLIYKCISSTSMAVVINGQPGPTFHPSRGIRQGCPLSPYLFILAVNELATCLQLNSDLHEIQGISLGPGCPKIHALLFADDLIICGQATKSEASRINHILHSFCAASGQTPNLSKSSIVFSKYTDPFSIKEVKEVFPVPQMSHNSIYLGHPLLFRHSDRAQAYNFIINKFRAKLTKLKAAKLNHAGRLVYINSVLAPIPIYYMSTILFSNKFITKINSIMRKFWWAGVPDNNESAGLNLRAWKDICRPKKEGGLGIRDLGTVNKSLLLNAAWKVATGKNEFLSDILKAKYHPNTSFWKAGNSQCKSVFWSSIMSVKDTLIKNCSIQIHKGNSSIWSSPWCSIWEEIHDHIKLPLMIPRLPSYVSDLWEPNKNWNKELISNIFDTSASTEISNITVVHSDKNDIVIWTPSNKGECTAKEAFRFLNNQVQVTMPTNGPRSISMQALNILCRIWKNKMIAPVLKTFMWKMLRNCLATGERAGSLSSKISRNCDYFGMTENDSHLFFHCNFSRAVWFSANPPLLTSNLPREQDGVQEALTALITPNTQDNIMIMIITTLWFIWKARNELRFRQKKWSILQVHFAAQAHRRTNDLLSMQTGVNGKTQKNLGSTQNQLDLAGIEDRGVVCFTDAAIKAVARPEAPETAGVGILFKDNSQNTLITISAQIRNCSSVLMAETAGLSIASSIAAALQLNQVKFFTDNQTLADLLQRANLDGSPDWRIRPLAQNFFNNRDRVSATVHKIDRKLNYKAHALAKSAFSASNLMRGQPVLSCSNMNHVPTCPLKAVLTALCNDCTVTAAICC